MNEPFILLFAQERLGMYSRDLLGNYSVSEDMSQSDIRDLMEEIVKYDRLVIRSLYKSLNSLIDYEALDSNKKMKLSNFV